MSRKILLLRRTARWARVSARSSPWRVTPGRFPSPQRDHHAEGTVMDGLDRVHPEAGREDPVEGGGRATALDVAEHGAAGLLPGALLDLVRETLPDAAQPDVPELIQLLIGEFQIGLRGMRPLRDHYDRRVPGLEPALHVRDNLVYLERPLRNQYHIGPARQPGVQGDPTGVPAHDLDDQGRHAGW